MNARKCALFLFNGYADWEPALAITGLVNPGGFSITTFSATSDPIVSMGGLKILPEKSISEVKAEDYDLLIIPGGEAFEKGGNTDLMPLIKSFREAGKVIAAICAATAALANAGILDNIPHTSNTLSFLKQLSPGYKGESMYRNTPCASADNIITANGAGMIEFAITLYRKFQIANDDTLNAVNDLYKSGGMENRLFT